MRKKLLRWDKTTKGLLTKEEQALLKGNPYVKTVNHKAITYIDEFKRHVIAENEKLPPATYRQQLQQVA